LKTGSKAITVSPQRKRLDLRFSVIRTEHVVQYLKQLYHELRHPIVIVLDHFPAHRSAARHLHLEGRRDWPSSDYRSMH
jgi:hypothetical protein